MSRAVAGLWEEQPSDGRHRKRVRIACTGNTSHASLSQAAYVASARSPRSPMRHVSCITSSQEALEHTDVLPAALLALVVPLKALSRPNFLLATGSAAGRFLLRSSPLVRYALRKAVDPVSRFHSSKVSSEILPSTSSWANLRRCALLLNGINRPCRCVDLAPPAEREPSRGAPREQQLGRPAP